MGFEVCTIWECETNSTALKEYVSALLAEMNAPASGSPPG